ncbi:DUF4124 domain-containing protein [Fundidesulfovibrio terrae]|uniref:DUF4124 domain-containing protein n=1 Tax=Fundidesulfovibrio terrae TaxID=2922866 RepID=UPI001FAFFC4C|nr:DUF4124 domain-containing protein [Fundidesulfovibrio terrae]
MRLPCTRVSLCAAGFVVLAALLLAAWPGLAEVYTWKDEKGVVHMSDRKALDAGKNVTEMTGVKGQPVQGGRREMIQAMLASARNDARYVELQKLAAEYKRSHTYSMADYFVCVDMALDMANILKTKNFAPKVVAGSFKVDTAGMAPDKAMKAYDHAWVVVELSPGVNVALETTGGFVVDEKIPNFEYYYQGLVFQSPRQAKETDVLIRSVNETCGKAQELIKDWNNTQAGRVVDQRGLEAKGRMDAKISECTSVSQQYAELIKSQYKRLY